MGPVRDAIFELSQQACAPAPVTLNPEAYQCVLKHFCFCLFAYLQIYPYPPLHLWTGVWIFLKHHYHQQHLHRHLIIFAEDRYLLQLWVLKFCEWLMVGCFGANSVPSFLPPNPLVSHAKLSPPIYLHWYKHQPTCQRCNLSRLSRRPVSQKSSWWLWNYFRKRRLLFLHLLKILFLFFCPPIRMFHVQR